MKKNCFTLVFLVLFLAGTFCTLSGQEVLGKEVKKKIISFGNSGFTPANVEKYLGELEEKWLPGYDGVNIITSKNVKLPDGKRLNLEWKWFSKTRFQKEWYSEEIKSLQNIHKKAKKFKYNFLDTSASSFTGEFDLFDDEFWEIVCNNFSVMAYVAKQGGCKGIRFDLEDYGNQQKFLYRTECGRSYEEAWQMARKRGQQWMRAVAKEFPDIDIFCFFWLDLMFGFADGMPDTKGRLEACTTGLLVAFINGIYDALPPTARIIDGMEERGYGAKNFTDFCAMRGMRDVRYKRLLAPENHKKLREQTSLAVATYLSAYYGKKDGFDTTQAREKEGLSQLDYFRRNLTFAVDFSDEYSWTYNGYLRKYSPVPSTHGWQEKNLLKSPEIPSPYIGMAIPGIEEAVLFAKDPHTFAMERIRKDKTLKNLLYNGDFEGTKKKNKDIPVAPACVEVKNVPYWILYKNKTSDVTVSLAKGMGIDKGTAIKISGKQGASIHANVRVQQGKVYVVRAVSKKTGKGGGILRIQWKNAKSKWHNHSMIISAPYNEDLGNGWFRATLFVREIPETSAYLCPLLTYTGTGKEDSILIDKVEVFSLFEGEAKVAPHLKDAMEKWQKMKEDNSKNALLKTAVKVSKTDKNERIVKGVFGGRNILTDEKVLSGNIVLCKADFQCGSAKKMPGKFFKAVGKNVGFSDDTAGVIKDGNGYFLFPVAGIKVGEKYKISVKVKKTSGNVLCKVQYSTPGVRGFDYARGIPVLKEKKALGNNWEEYSGVITIPEKVNRFSVIVSTKGLKKGDLLFIDDVSAIKAE